jgi:hypothetical protein
MALLDCMREPLHELLSEPHASLTERAYDLFANYLTYELKIGVVIALAYIQAAYGIRAWLQSVKQGATECFILVRQTPWGRHVRAVFERFRAVIVDLYF